MEIFLDDKRVDAAFIGSHTLEEALRHVQMSLCDPNDMVLGLRCDGCDIKPDAMTEALQKPAASFERVEIFTGPKGQLVTDAMTQASACLEETKDACGRVAELLIEGKSVEAAETLVDCLRVWQQIHEAMAKSIEMLAIDPDRTMINDEPLSTLIAKPKEVLLQVKAALQARDNVLLADILQYEFGEVLLNWHQMIAKLRQEAEDHLASCALDTSRPATASKSKSTTSQAGPPRSSDVG